MRYDKEHSKEIVFPLGGIGTGSIGLTAEGRLVDFEIFNCPNKGSINGYTHFAIHAVEEGAITLTSLSLPYLTKAESVTADGKALDFRFTEGVITFPKTTFKEIVIE